MTTASKFKSDIKIVSNGKEANAKSIMNLMALGVKSGTEIELRVTGADAAAAQDAIVATMKNAKLI